MPRPWGNRNGAGFCLPHLFDLSCLHCAYINKMAYKPEPVSHCLFGAPEAIRTPDLRIRNPLLYPAELRVELYDLIL